MVQELHQLLMDREDTCHRTCFSLHFNGITLDNFSELKAVEGIKEGSEIKVIEGSNMNFFIILTTMGVGSRGQEAILSLFLSRFSYMG